jgi:L-iditol 2-dehydrogenase
MRAQVFYEPENMKLVDMDVPKISPQEVLVKVKACGICGSDIAYYYGKSPLETKTGKGPLVLGHEFAGEVVEVGDIARALNLLKPGDRVVANPVQYCNSCRMCARGDFNLCENSRVSGVSVDGAFAEYAKVNYNNLIRIPENVSFEQAALIEPLSCSTYAVTNADIRLGDFTVVIGPGPIGLMMIQLAKAKGAGKVALIGRRDYPLIVGKAVGADHVFNIADQRSPYYSNDVIGDMQTLTDSFMADRALVATSSIDAAQLALKLTGKKSIIVFFGLGGTQDVLKIPMLETLTSDKRLVFSWLAPRVWPLAINTISTGQVKLDRIITHRFPLNDLAAALQFMGKGKEEKMKGIITY